MFRVLKSFSRSVKLCNHKAACFADHPLNIAVQELPTTEQHRDDSWHNPFFYHMAVVTPAGKILSVSSHNAAAVPELVKQAEQSVLALAQASSNVAKEHWVRGAHVARNVQSITTTTRAASGIATAFDHEEAFDHVFGKHFADLVAEKEAVLAQKTPDEIVDLVKTARAIR